MSAWESKTAWPLFAASVVFFGATTWLLIDERTSWLLTGLLSLVIAVLWLYFIVDYLVRLAMAKGARLSFVRTRVFDLVSLLIPYLRPFLILIYIWRLPMFRHGSPSTQRRRYLITMILFSFFFVYTASLGVWIVERNAPKANIVDFGDALWWGFTTISTVGYGDFVPVTTPGRIIAVGLMMGGIAVIGVTTATLISAINERISKASPNAGRSDTAS